MTRRTTITVDDAVLVAAQRALGSHGIQDTVDRALQEVIRSHRRVRLAHAIRSGSAFDFEHAALDRSEAWRAS